MTRSRLGNAAITADADTTAIEAAHIAHRGELLRMVPVAALARSPWQPRVSIDRGEEFEALVDSVRTYGVLEPVLVRELPSGALELLAGERRLEAVRAVPLAMIPARVLQGLSDAAARAVAITENLARKDLSAWEEAQAVGLLRAARAAESMATDVRSMGMAAGRSKSLTAELLAIAERITPAVVQEATERAGGAFVRTLDALPHRDLASIAKAATDAERAALLALACGPRPDAVPSAARGESAPSGEATAPRSASLTPAFVLQGVDTGRVRLKVARPLHELSANDAEALLLALAPVLKTLRARAKSESQ